MCYMQTSCRQTSSESASTSGRSTAKRHCGCPITVHAVHPRSKHGLKLRKELSLKEFCSQASRRTSLKPHATAQQRQRHICLCAREHTSSTRNGSNKGPVIVIDNYDSFTYNICQVRDATTRSIHKPQSSLHSPILVGCSTLEI